MRWRAGLFAPVVAAVVAAVAVGACSGVSKPSSSPDSFPTGTVATGSGGTGSYAATGLNGGPPWPSQQNGVSTRAVAAGLQMLPREALTEHVHAHLDVYYDQVSVVVPAYVGIDYIAQAISPLHTHDESGIVHIESPVFKPYYLGQFFQEWGVAMANGCVAGQCPPSRPVAVYVNGVKTTSAPEDVVLHGHDEIVVAIGTPPVSIPSSYPFPAGY